MNMIKKEIKSCSTMSSFLLKFAELKYQRQLWEGSEKDLNEAMDYQNKARVAFV
jgi:hypothetical protein